MGQPENGFVQPLGAGLALSQAVPRSSTSGELWWGQFRSAWWSWWYEEHSILTSKASKARNPLMRCQQSLESSSVPMGRVWWAGNGLESFEIEGNVGSGVVWAVPEQCVLHPCSQSCSFPMCSAQWPWAAGGSGISSLTWWERNDFFQSIRCPSAQRASL